MDIKKRLYIRFMIGWAAILLYSSYFITLSKATASFVLASPILVVRL